MAPCLLLRPDGSVQLPDIGGCQNPRVQRARHSRCGWEVPLQGGQVEVRVVLGALCIPLRAGPADLQHMTRRRGILAAGFPHHKQRWDMPRDGDAIARAAKHRRRAAPGFGGCVGRRRCFIYPVCGACGGVCAALAAVLWGPAIRQSVSDCAGATTWAAVRPAAAGANLAAATSAPLLPKHPTPSRVIFPWACLMSSVAHVGLVVEKGWVGKTPRGHRQPSWCSRWQWPVPEPTHQRGGPNGRSHRGRRGLGAGSSPR